MQSEYQGGILRNQRALSFGTRGRNPSEQEGGIVGIRTNAGIAEKYYKPLYDYLSSYSHGYPLSLEQILAISRVEDVLALLTPFMFACSGYLCFSIRDFIKLFPDQEVFVDSFVRQNLALYEEHFRPEV